MSLVECVSITPGDEIRVDGEWLDVVDVRKVSPAGELMVLIVCDNEPGLPAREFLAAPFAHRRVKRHEPIRPTIDPSAQ